LLFFKGTCTRGIYDNMKTAVETVFIGKDRQFNRRFLRMCGHYLVEPTACTPASAGRRDRSRTRPGGARAFLHAAAAGGELRGAERLALDRCVAYAKAHKHPELTDRT
jgi:hypothetical protein